MSGLLGQMEVKVARAERAFVRLRKIIAAAGEDLQTQQLWLDHNRAGPLKGQRPLSNIRVIWAFARFAVGLPLLLPVGSVKGRTIVSALGLMILLLIAAGAVRATMPASQCEVPLSLALKVAPAALPALNCAAQVNSACTFIRGLQAHTGSLRPRTSTAVSVLNPQHDVDRKHHASLTNKG